MYNEKEVLREEGYFVTINNVKGFMIEGTHRSVKSIREFIVKNHPSVYIYDLRHGDSDWSEPVSIEHWVMVNYFGIFLSREMALLPDVKFVEITEENSEINFANYGSLDEWLKNEIPSES